MVKIVNAKFANKKTRDVNKGLFAWMLGTPGRLGNPPR